MITVLAVALGAAIGAPIRFALERHYTRGVFPRGLLVVNILGSLIAGIAMAITDGVLRTFLMVGFCGALTTYSGFAWQAAQLWHERRSMMWWMIAAMTIGSTLAFWLGYSSIHIS
jgi:fluoride exporter